MKKQLSLFLVFFSGLMTSFGQSSGPSTPLVYSTSGDGTSWANLAGIQVVDNNPAYSDLAQYPTCNSFQCYYSNIASFTGIGFSIPGSATITGIKLDAMQRVSSPGGGIRDSMLHPSLNGTNHGVDHADSDFWLDTPTILAEGVRVEVRNLTGNIHYAMNIEQGQRKLNINVDAHSWTADIFVVSIISSEFERVQRKLLLIN